ncbi:NAD(P)H-binding protein [Nocardiopsis dassonvillei]|uniref:NAD(P)H-binding protein n=1 Tax=Nocardiopsis dassonvillei TaxID=2014 RepID=UPI00363381E1
MILVTGATGVIGRILVDRLLEAGQPVRALSRNPDAANLPEAVETVKGDLNSPGDLGPAFDGVTSVYYLPAMEEPERAKKLSQAFVKLAETKGVRKIVTLTSSSVTAERPGSYEELYEVEQVVNESRLEATHLRPDEFALNKIDTWGYSVQTEDVIRNAFPEALGVPVHEADIAEVAAKVLLEDGHGGRAYTLTGPEALSHREQAQAISEGIGRPIRFEPQTYGQARAAYIRFGLPGEIVEYILGYQAEYAEEPPRVHPDVETVLGRPGRTLAQWAADHVEDFAPVTDSGDA